MIAAVYRTWHDTAPYLRYGVMVLRWATPYRVIPGEGRITIASYSSDRPGANARRQAPAEIDVQHEADGRVSVHQAVPRHRGANITGQRQIAVLD
jgi:hypothetical protein